MEILSKILENRGILYPLFIFGLLLNIVLYISLKMNSLKIKKELMTLLERVKYHVKCNENQLRSMHNQLKTDKSYTPIKSAVSEISSKEVTQNNKNKDIHVIYNDLKESYAKISAIIEAVNKLSVTDKTLDQLQKVSEYLRAIEEDVANFSPKDEFLEFIKLSHEDRFASIKSLVVKFEQNSEDNDKIKAFISDTSKVLVLNSLSFDSLERLVAEMSDYLAIKGLHLIAPLPKAPYNDEEVNRLKIVSSSNVNQVNTLIAWGVKKDGSVIKKADIYAGN